MLKRVLKLGIAVVYYLGQEVVFYAFKMLGFPRARFAILTYHQMAARDLRGFERQLGMILNCGTPVFADFVPPCKGLGRFIAITFDDFLAEALATAGVVLKQRHLPSTWFVVSKYLGGSVDWIRNSQKANDRASIGSADDMTRLDKSLFRIASHTATHSNLTSLSRNKVFLELMESRAHLNAVWSESVTSISFPYGEYDSEILRLCESAGYRFAFANLPVWRCSSRQGFLRGRVSVEPGDWPCEFWLKIRGGYDWQAISGFLRYRCLPRFRRVIAPVKCVD